MRHGREKKGEVVRRRHQSALVVERSAHPSTRSYHCAIGVTTGSVTFKTAVRLLCCSEKWQSTATSVGTGASRSGSPSTRSSWCAVVAPQTRSQVHLLHPRCPHQVHVLHPTGQLVHTRQSVDFSSRSLSASWRSFSRRLSVLIASSSATLMFTWSP